MKSGLLLLLVLTLCSQLALAQSNKLTTEDKWSGAIAWVAITIILAGAALSFLATDWQLWLGRERQKRWLAGTITMGLLTAVAICLGAAGLILAWANLQPAKKREPDTDIQSIYSSILALYLGTYGFLILYGFTFFNRKSVAWGGIFWAVAVLASIACLVLMWWISRTAFGIFFFFPFWLFVSGCVMFWVYRNNKDAICETEQVQLKHVSHYSSVSHDPYSRSSTVATKEKIARINF